MPRSLTVGLLLAVLVYCTSTFSLAIAFGFQGDTWGGICMLWGVICGAVGVAWGTSM